MALTMRLALTLAAQLTKPLDLSAPVDSINYAKTISLASGTGSGQGDMMWHDQRTIAASGTDSLDLAGVLTNAFGVTQTFARIKGVLVAAASGNTNNVNVTRDATNGVPLFLAASDGIPVRPGGLFVWMATDATAVPVTAGTGDLLVIANSGAGTSVTYDVIILGASA